MAARLSLLPILTFLAWLPGCSVCDYAKLTSRIEPALFSRKNDEVASIATYKAMADQAWAESGCECPPDLSHKDYAWGFREGFADFVYAGGNGEPPAVAPRPYWQVDMRNPAGAVIVRSWFEGYRHGARIAQEGGYRQTATVLASASVRDCTPCGCPDDSGCRSGASVLVTPNASGIPPGAFLAEPIATPTESSSLAAPVAPESHQPKLPSLNDAHEPEEERPHDGSVNPAGPPQELLLLPVEDSPNMSATSSEQRGVHQTTTVQEVPLPSQPQQLQQPRRKKQRLLLPVVR